METLTLEDTHELLDILNSDNVRELLEEFIVLRGFDESIGECLDSHLWVGEPTYCDKCGVDKGQEAN